jgi:hypothetical protein
MKAKLNTMKKVSVANKKVLKTNSSVKLETCDSCKTCSTDLVDIRKDAFAFCRYGVMVLVWIAFIFKIKWLVLLVFGILVLSAILGVQYAPMILLYNYTVGLFFKFKTESLGISGMRFAHTLGSFLSGLAVLFLFFWNVKIGWSITLFLAIMKTISALGLCPAYKLYNCMKSGGCCSFTKRLSK